MHHHYILNCKLYNRLYGFQFSEFSISKSQYFHSCISCLFLRSVMCVCCIEWFRLNVFVRKKALGLASSTSACN